MSLHSAEHAPEGNVRHMADRALHLREPATHLSNRRGVWARGFVESAHPARESSHCECCNIRACARPLAFPLRHPRPKSSHIPHTPHCRADQIGVAATTSGNSE